MRLLCVTLVALLLISGCSDSEPSTSPDPGPEKTEGVVEAPLLTAEELSSALLTIDDFPEGFVPVEPDDDEDDGNEIVNATAPSCSALDEALSGPDGDDVAEATASFESDGGLLVDHFLASATDEAITSQLDAAQGALADCTSFVLRDSEGSETTFEPSAMESPELGDRTVAIAMRVHASDGSFEVTGQASLFLINVGTNVMLVSVLSLDQLGAPLDPETFRELAVAAVEKIEDATA